MNGYLAYGRRMQVPHTHRGYWYKYCEWPEVTLRYVAIEERRLPAATVRTLYIVHLVYSDDFVGPVEGDGSWHERNMYTPGFERARCVIVWVEPGCVRFTGASELPPERVIR